MYLGFPGGAVVKNLLAIWETQVRSLDTEDHLEKGMATHSSILAQRIPWTERSLVSYSPWGRKELDTMSDFHSLTQSLMCTQIPWVSG